MSWSALQENSAQYGKLVNYANFKDNFVVAFAAFLMGKTLFEVLFKLTGLGRIL
jgi:hypothetical protein